jgi:hypothetical protein
MLDWLTQLRSRKTQAIDDQQRLIERGQRRSQLCIQQLHDGHTFILDTVQRTTLETLLLQIASEVVAGHPEYPNAYLHRVVSYHIEAALAYVNTYVDDPWQGYLWDAHGHHRVVRLLPAQPELPSGFYLTQVRWQLHLKDIVESDYRVTDALLVTITPHSLEVNAHGIQPLDCVTVQHALVRGIEHPSKINVY